MTGIHLVAYVMTMPADWHLSPVAVVALVVALLNERGRRTLAKRQGATLRRATLRRSILLDVGLVALALLASGPTEKWAMQSLLVHMVVHVFDMFFLPPLLVAGAPLVPLWFAFGVTRRRRLLRWYYVSPTGKLLGGVVRKLTSPLVSVVLFNATMIFWHISAVFNWASWNEWVMDWLMTPSFIIVGVLFWRIILSSYPRRPKATPAFQVAAVVATAFEMLVLAIAMGVMTKVAWYSMPVDMYGPVTAFHQQRLGAGVLWICGDFWVAPALVLIGYRVFKRGEPTGLKLDAMVLGR